MRYIQKLDHINKVSMQLICFLITDIKICKLSMTVRLHEHHNSTFKRDMKLNKVKSTQMDEHMHERVGFLSLQFK